jgi:hypothetical protein
MIHQIKRCVSCGKTIGHYSIFSHAHDEADSGDAEYNNEYGGKIEGEDYCIDCYSAANASKECDLFLENKSVQKRQAIKSNRSFPGTYRGWGPVTRSLDGE